MPSSSRVGRTGGASVVMNAVLVPAPLRQKLGEDAAQGLVDMFAAYHEFNTERFERRLNETVTGLRLEMAAMREDMHRLEARLLKWTLGIWMAQLAFEAGLIMAVAGYVLRRS
jgi:hypothetical protein